VVFPVPPFWLSIATVFILLYCHIAALPAMWQLDLLHCWQLGNSGFPRWIFLSVIPILKPNPTGYVSP
jgi:hypothetical protein